MHGTFEPATALIEDMGQRARAAARILAIMPAAQKALALEKIAQQLRAHQVKILAANHRDVVSAEAAALSAATIDRLRLDAGRLEAIAESVETIAALRDPVGMVIDHRTRPNGLKLSRVRVPLGVIGIIYESRPNVTVDAGALCLKSGNACILRGGSDALETSKALHIAMVEGLSELGLPADAIQLVQERDRAIVGAMLRAQAHIDVIIPRGGKALVARVQDEARVPVLAHLDGICHSYVDGAADMGKARDIIVNAKMRRPGVCGATEIVLIDRAFAAPQLVITALLDSGCEVRGDAAVCALEPRAVTANADDWDTEYLGPICAVAMVDGLAGALAHIARHSSAHTDAIITESDGVAEQFLREVDSAIVMWNASTQFADGGEFGMGAEIGIATGRLHARGPVALEGLTTYKWLVRGSGQIRP